MNLKKEFSKWMGKNYPATSVRNCTTLLNTAANKLDIVLIGTETNTIFECSSYKDFLENEKEIRNHPMFPVIDGKGKAQRWIDNGLDLYGTFLLEREIDNSIKDVDESATIIATSEGKKVCYYVSKYERKRKNRDAAIAVHGTLCACCGFDFEKKYGEIGKGYIEVHHIRPLYSIDEEVEINPSEDLVCLCANCHRMIHRSKYEIITVEDLKNMMLSKEKQ